MIGFGTVQCLDCCSRAPTIVGSCLSTAFIMTELVQLVILLAYMELREVNTLDVHDRYL